MTAGHSEVGRGLRQLRHARDKSLTVIAGLAGISASYLSRLENGERALDRRSLIVALANALEVAPTEITGAELAMPGKADDDRAVSEVRLALLAVSLDEPRGELQPVEQLSARVKSVLAAQNNANTSWVGAALPGLIRDLHAVARVQDGEPEVLRLLTLAHMQGTQAWLCTVGAPIDLAWQAAALARAAAERLDEPTSLGVSAYGTALGLLGAGAFELAATTLTTVDLPLATTEDLQLAGSLALASSLIYATREDQAERSAALDYAAELAERTGETNVSGFGFGPPTSRCGGCSAPWRPANIPRSPPSPRRSTRAHSPSGPVRPSTGANMAGLSHGRPNGGIRPC
ncbi:MAG: helix-turn-helix domain-containing protein [Labedaea sp.]